MIHTYVAPKLTAATYVNSKVLVSWPAWVEAKASATSGI